ncbi:MAG: RES domain-containing protein [Bryobacteraceae bacterium]
MKNQICLRIGAARYLPRKRKTSDLGTGWVIRAATAVLSVPSVIVPSERNYLLNPAHPDFVRIRFSPPRPFTFDKRLKPAR